MKESKCTNCGWFGPTSLVTPEKCPQCKENTMVEVIQSIKGSDKYKFCNHHHELTPEQEIINLGTGPFVADKPMIPLLKALNEIGLTTRSHCHGHETDYSWVTILMDNIDQVEVRNLYGKQELLIQWKKVK